MPAINPGRRRLRRTSRGIQALALAASTRQKSGCQACYLPPSRAWHSPISDHAIRKLSRFTQRDGLGRSSQHGWGGCIAYEPPEQDHGTRRAEIRGDNP